jgi:hypothetical protein
VAKIALFCESYHETTRDLARALHSLRHEVILVTSRNVQHDEHLPFPVLTYFKKWSALEALKFIPRFISHAPDVWHFSFPEPKKNPPKGAHLVLAALANGFPRRIAMASFFSVLPKVSVTLRSLLPLCHAVTFGAREDLMNAKRSGLVKHTSLLEVFPPLPKSQSLAPASLPEDFLKLIKNLQTYLFVWSEDVPVEMINAAHRAHLKILAKGPRNLHLDQKNIWFLPEGVSQQQIQFAAQNSKGIALQNNDLELSELHRFQSLSQAGRVPLFVSPRQAEALPGLCLHQRSGWIIHSHEEWSQLLQSSEFNKFRYQSGPESSFSLQDSAINDLNRLMIKALAKV